MIKTLRITSVAAVVLAAVVFASVLGYLGPVSFLPWRAGPGADKQTEKILGGPSAAERFTSLYGKAVSTGDTTPPLIRQAETFAGIIDPPPLPDAPTPPPVNPSARPPTPIKPSVVSSKFDLLMTCYSSNPKASYAYIRLPGDICQWVGVDDQIGHMAIKEIRQDLIVCWDGKNDVTIRVEAVPETSSLLETAKSSAVVPVAAPPTDSATAARNGAAPGPAGVTAAPTDTTTAPTGAAAAQNEGAAQSAPAAFPKRSVSAAKLSVIASQPSMPATAVPSAHISSQEQEKLSRLGDRLKNDVGTDALGRTESANRLISEFKSDRGLPPGVEKLGNTADDDPGPEPLKNSLRDEARRRYIGRLTPPRPKQP